jgi:hypothetical protein
MLAFFRRPRTQRLREYERQLAIHVTVLAITTIAETKRHDLNRRRQRKPIDRSAPRERGTDAIPPFVARVSRRRALFAARVGTENEMRRKLVWPGLLLGIPSVLQAASPGCPRFLPLRVRTRRGNQDVFHSSSRQRLSPGIYA